jgi:protein O-mannosyl-transferase
LREISHGGDLAGRVDSPDEDETDGSKMPKRTTPLTEPPRSQLHIVLGICGLLLLAVWLVFRPATDYGFVNFDDDVYVTDNPELLDGLSPKGIAFALTTTRGSQWAPLTWLSYLLDYEVYGLAPWGYHLTNLLLHAATTVLLFLVLRQMTGGLWSSAFVAAVFAIHPLRVESVVWVAERKDVLSGLFFVLTLGAYLHYVRNRFSLARYAAVVVLFVLGLIAKPMLVTLPLVLLLLDYWPLGRFSQSGGNKNGKTSSGADMPGEIVPARLWLLLVEKVPLLLIAAVFCVIATWAQGKAVIALERLPIASRVANALVSSVAYLGKWLWPTNLAVFYPHPLDGLPAWKPAAALSVLLAVTAVVLIYWRRKPYLLVGWFWYLIMLVPVIGIVQVGRQSMADRYTYLPQIGLSIALAWGVAGVAVAWPRRRWVYAAAGVLIVAGLAVCASRQTTHWRDSESLWDRAIACTSANSRARYCLGEELSKQKRFTEAIPHYEEAIRIEPQDATNYNSLGNALAALGDLDKGIEQYGQAIRINPRYAEARSNLGVALVRQKRLEEAVSQYEEALKAEPNRAETRCNFGNALARMHRFDEAIAQYEAALSLQPNRDEIRRNLDTVRAMRRKIQR